MALSISLKNLHPYICKSQSIEILINKKLTEGECNTYFDSSREIVHLLSCLRLGCSVVESPLLFTSFWPSFEQLDLLEYASSFSFNLVEGAFPIVPPNSYDAEVLWCYTLKKEYRAFSLRGSDSLMALA